MTSLFDENLPMDAARTLALYQRFYASQGPSLPAGKSQDMRFVDALSDVVDDCQGLILDSYGVIGLGSAPIEGITDLFDNAKARDIPIVILTNGASQPASQRVKGYRDWGLPIAASDIISSRDAAHQMVREIKDHNPEARFSYLGRHVTAFEDVKGPIYGDGDDSWDEADYFIFLGAIGWDAADQAYFESVLAKTAAQVIIGNPDVSAPVVGAFTFEPGYWGMRANHHVNAPLLMAGKPYPAAYDLAFAALQEKAGKPLDKAHIGMVGDSLHTDILGAKSSGFFAILLSHYGLLAGRDVTKEADLAQIYPDVVAKYLVR